eukprot:6486395-Amphidinium_carterae.4
MGMAKLKQLVRYLKLWPSCTWQFDYQSEPEVIDFFVGCNYGCGETYRIQVNGLCARFPRFTAGSSMWFATQAPGGRYGTEGAVVSSVRLKWNGSRKAHEACADTLPMAATAHLSVSLRWSATVRDLRSYFSSVLPDKVGKQSAREERTQKD